MNAMDRIMQKLPNPLDRFEKVSPEIAQEWDLAFKKMGEEIRNGAIVYLKKERIREIQTAVKARTTFIC